MSNLEIKEYLSLIGIRKINELDMALIEAFGQEEGKWHIEKLTKLFDRSEERLLYGARDTVGGHGVTGHRGNDHRVENHRRDLHSQVYLHRQEELVDYWNQSLQMSLLAASFYDRVFFRRTMEYLLKQDCFWSGNIFDIGCGNGILTCFLALQHPDSMVTGLEISSNAVSVAKELAEKLTVDNVHFFKTDELPQGRCDTLFSCRTVHENVAWRALCEESKSALPVEEQTRRHSRYAKELSALVKPSGYLVSVERYEDDGAYAGLVRALEREGFCQVKGTHMQFSCKNGDGTGTFQAMIFQR